MPKAAPKRQWYDLHPRRLGVWLAAFVRTLTSALGARAGVRLAAQTANRLAPIVTVSTAKGALRFRCPSFTAARRATNFASSEPETRQWLDEYLKPGDHLWDVGANVGDHTLYACFSRGVTVTAFEPVPDTFAALSGNVQANGFGERATCLCVALSDTDALMPIYLIEADAGAAMHALGAPVNVEGAFQPAGVVTVLTARGDDLVERFGVRRPQHVKIDVDGHELRVLEGMTSLLPQVTSVWIEMLDLDKNAAENARIESVLIAAGLVERRRVGLNRLFVKPVRER